MALKCGKLTSLIILLVCISVDTNQEGNIQVPSSAKAHIVSDIETSATPETNSDALKAMTITQIFRPLKEPVSIMTTSTTWPNVTEFTMMSQENISLKTGDTGTTPFSTQAAEHENIKKLSEQMDNKQGQLTTADIDKAMDALDSLMADIATLSEKSTSDIAVTMISKLMNADVTQFKESGTDSNQAANRMMRFIDILLEKVELTDGQFVSTAPNLIVAARAVNASTFTGLALITNADDKKLDTPEFQSTPTVAKNGNRVSSLALPASLLSSMANVTEVRISMTVHRTAILFEAMRGYVSRPANTSDHVSKINSQVLSASVGLIITNLTDPVTIVLAHHNQNSVRPKCVFWDSNLNDWSTEGCWMNEENSTDSLTICECYHLTNFALLMDVYSTGSSVGETDRKILSVVSYIGCGTSLLALLLTLITHGVFGGFRNVRRPSCYERNQHDNPSKILFNLCLALALTNLIFIAGMHDYTFKSLPACKFVAAFLHFSLLAALGWMAVEAVYMYLAIVLVIKTNYSNFIIKCSLAGWGAPLVITVITLSVNKTDNYGMLDSGVCWLKGNAFYIAFLAPICAILLMNFIVFGLVLRRIMRLSERKLSNSSQCMAKKQLRGAVGVVILLGLTWAFAIFAIDRASIVFNYLFAIFNSLQGLFIFLYNCVFNTEIRMAWMNKFRSSRMYEETSDVTTNKSTRVTNGGASTGKSEQSTVYSAVTDTSVNEATPRPSQSSDRLANDLDLNSPVIAKETPCTNIAE